MIPPFNLLDPSQFNFKLQIRIKLRKMNQWNTTWEVCG